jgi:hypothetical protein
MRAVGNGLGGPEFEFGFGAREFSKEPPDGFGARRVSCSRGIECYPGVKGSEREVELSRASSDEAKYVQSNACIHLLYFIASTGQLCIFYPTT